MTERDSRTTGEDASEMPITPVRPAADAATGPSCSAGGSLLIRLDARPRFDGEIHASARGIHAKHGPFDFDPSGAIIPSDEPLVRI